jgi:hypothetical protein
MIRCNPMYNYGAVQSIREQAASPNYRMYFQKLDKEMHVKTIEQNILDAIIDFLDNHGVDTASLRERQSTILNNGVIVTGGSIHADNFAVGNQATASFTSKLAGGGGGRARTASMPAAPAA